ncbi:MAG TPA: hypothetical protein VNZ67_15010 [bacterium]|jgi:hypothetical protein|nr:hypothetical protein [bacterium]
MKMRPIPLPQIIPEAPSTGPSYRSDRVAAQQLAKAERRRKRKESQDAGDEAEQGAEPSVPGPAQAPVPSRHSETQGTPGAGTRPSQGPGSRFDSLA